MDLAFSSETGFESDCRDAHFRVTLKYGLFRPRVFGTTVA